jgi:hypothetical protein
MKVVSDASPVILFARAGFLPLFEGLFGKILVSEEVYQEMTAPEKSGTEEIRRAKSIKRKRLKNPNRLLAFKSYGVSQADTTVISLAIEQEADLVIIDDKRLRRLAKEMGLPVVGSGGILLQAKRKGIITEVKDKLDFIIGYGARIAEPLYHQILKSAGEESNNGASRLHD